MVLMKDKRSNGQTVIESPEVEKYFGWETRKTNHLITTQIWYIDELRGDLCTDTTIKKYCNGSTVVIDISSASCGGNIEDMEKKIKELQLATAIAKSYEN